MPVRIPFEGTTPNYRFSTTLDGTPYIFDVRWNGREGAWYFDLLDDEADVIISGVKVVLGVFLGRRSTDERFPPGIIAAADLENSGTEAGLDDLGDRVSVYYFNAEEAASRFGYVRNPGTQAGTALADLADDFFVEVF